MMPMWIFSGVFFSYERFPAVVQPLIKALPLTALNDALRATILEGARWPRSPAGYWCCRVGRDFVCPGAALVPLDLDQHSAVSSQPSVLLVPAVALT